MTASATPDTRLDEHTEAELTPPCEVYAIHICLTHGTHAQRCEQAATWIARTSCTCGASDTSLVCDEHIDDLRRGVGRSICQGCGTVRTPDRVQIERL